MNDPDPNTGKLDPSQPNKFEPEHHDPFPTQTNHGHGEPGSKTDQQKKNR